MPTAQTNKSVLTATLKEILVYVFLLLIIILTTLNMQSFLSTPKTRVLAAETQEDSSFWQEFLSQNPYYVPGWIETNRPDKVNEIDPNYLSGF